MSKSIQVHSHLWAVDDEGMRLAAVVVLLCFQEAHNRVAQLLRMRNRGTM